jgi:hypothetical protein
VNSYIVYALTTKMEALQVLRHLKNTANLFSWKSNREEERLFFKRVAVWTVYDAVSKHCTDLSTIYLPTMTHN